MESDINILQDVKSILDPLTVEDSEDFNNQILAYIDSTILMLAQKGCIKKTMPIITAESLYSDIINPPTNIEYDNEATFSAIRTVIRFTVKTLFDPPVQNVMNIYQTIIEENKWRIGEAYEL